MWTPPLDFGAVFLSNPCLEGDLGEGGRHKGRHRRVVTLFWSGALGAPDLCSSFAADPGADRGFSTVTSMIHETVTLLRERIYFFRRAGDSTGGPATFGHTSDSTGGRAYNTPPDDRDVRLRSVLEHHDKKAHVRALEHHDNKA